MKKINEQLILDLELFAIGFLTILSTIFLIINYNTAPGTIVSYWMLFSILIADRLTLKKVTNIFIWKIIFVLGVVILILKNISWGFNFIPTIKNIEIADILSNVLVLLLINIITLLFIYRAYKFITKGV